MPFAHRAQLYRQLDPDPNGSAESPADSLPPVRVASLEAKRRFRWIIRSAVGALLALYGLLAWTGSFSKGLSFDEGVQLAVGYNLWLNNDYRIEGANGDLVKRWATIPFLVSRPKFVGQDDVFWKGSRAYELGQRFLFEIGNRPEELLRQSRAMVALLGVVTGLMVFLCSREIFGTTGALISLIVFVFSPEMLAFGGVVSTDMSITMTLFGSTWCVWRLLHRITVWRLLASLLLAGLMVLAKPTALAIFPIAAVLVAVKLVRAEPLHISIRKMRLVVSGRRRQLAVIALVAVLHVAAGWVALWAHYGFRYQARPPAADSNLAFFQPYSRDSVPAPLVAILDWVERAHLLPEGFHVGIDSLLRCDDQLGAFMRGEWSLGGWPWFFPYAIWVKTAPALFVLLLLGSGIWLTRRRFLRRSGRGSWSLDTIFYHTTPFLALVGCYLAVAMTENINIGHRHVLPIYPALYVLAGGAVFLWRWWAKGKLIVAAILVWLAVDSTAIRPHYLAYFGPQAGGPENGYKHLVDSSLDWGMDLPALRRWIAEHDPAGKETLFLAYFGSDRPSYHRIRARRLPGFLERRKFEPYALAPGYYAISASLFQGVYTAAYGAWSKEYERFYQIVQQNVLLFESTASDPKKRAELVKRRPLVAWMRDYDDFENLRFARLCAWLRHQGEPPEHVGHSIFIWKLDYAALEAALLGPPVELVDEPPVLRRFRQFTVASAQ